MNNIDIEEMLGQNNIYKGITENAFGRSYLILGDIGQGKKYIVNKIKDFLGTKKNVKILQFKVDSLKYDYSPFLTAISEQENLFLNKSSKLLKDLSEFIPVIGGVVGAFANRQEMLPAEFTDVEVDIIKRIRSISLNSKLVLICSELSYWDMPSLILLQKMLAHFEVLKVKSCFICTDFKPSVIDMNNFSETFVLNTLPDDSAPEVIKYLAPDTNIPDDTVKDMCAACKGNIGILKSILYYLSDLGINTNISGELRHMIISQLEDRDNCALLLDKASIIGCSSQRSILKTYTSIDEFNFSNIIDYMVKKHLLKDCSTTVDFLSQSLWNIFNTHNKNNKRYHYDYAQCIRAVMPAKYDLIASEFFLGGIIEESAIYYVLSSLHNYIAYRIRPIFNDSIRNIINQYNLMPYFEKMIDLYDKYFKYNLSDICVFPKESEPRLQFEADYLEANYLLNFKIEKPYYRRAFNKMKFWFEDDKFAETSPEQWLRAAFTALCISVELHEVNVPWYFEKIENITKKFINSDLKIAVMHYDFFAKSNSCFSIDIAENNVIEAVNYFKEHQDSLPNSFKYITALNNALANAVVMGRDDLAKEYCGELVNYLKEPDTYIEYFSGAIINNIYLAVLQLSKSSFIKSFELIESTLLSLIEKHCDEISEILYRNNLAVFCMYCGQIEKAHTMINKLYWQIGNNQDIDDYYLYFVKSNYYIFNYIITGTIDTNAVFTELNALRPLENDMKYFCARNEYMKDKISAGYKIDLQYDNWNNFSEVRVGKAWHFWGRWMLLSDIQFWSD